MCTQGPEILGELQAVTTQIKISMIMCAFILITNLMQIITPEPNIKEALGFTRMSQNMHQLKITTILRRTNIRNIKTNPFLASRGN